MTSTLKGLPSFLFLMVLSTSALESKASISPENQQPMPCNSCCQGPAGIQGNPGIPGMPGTHGIPGNIGQKGERGIQGDSVKGEPGLSGEKGDPGSPGLKGGDGIAGLRGLPGKSGPPGSAGQAGSPGQPGMKGQKGEIGRSRVSAFSAVRSTSFTPSSNNEALPFTQVHTNVGNDFEAESGQFTCRIPGIYLFTYSIMTYTHEPYVHLMKNEVLINTVFRQDEDSYDMVSNTGVLQLDAGDQVWLKCYPAPRTVFSGTYFYTTFSGVILHEM